MPRVLVVEDNPGDQHLIDTLLRKCEPTLEIEICEDGEQALSRLGAPPPQGEFDLVLIDWNVPRRSGREVLEELSHRPDFRRVPIVVLSSSQAPSDVAAAYDFGASGYVVKPIGYQEFSQRMSAVVDYWFSTVRPPPKQASAKRSSPSGVPKIKSGPIK